MTPQGRTKRNLHTLTPDDKGPQGPLQSRLESGDDQRQRKGRWGVGGRRGHHASATEAGTPYSPRNPRTLKTQGSAHSGAASRPGSRISGKRSHPLCRTLSCPRPGRDTPNPAHRGWEDPEGPRDPQTHDLPRPDSPICPKAPDAAGRGLLLRRFSPWGPPLRLPRPPFRGAGSGPTGQTHPGERSSRGGRGGSLFRAPLPRRRDADGPVRSLPPRAAAPPPLGPSGLARELRGRARGSPIEPSPA